MLVSFDVKPNLQTCYRAYFAPHRVRKSLLPASWLVAYKSVHHRHPLNNMYDLHVRWCRMKAEINSLSVEAPSVVPEKKAGSWIYNCWQECLVFMAISVAAYLGTLIRVAFQYYRGQARSPANLTVIYPNLLVLFDWVCVRERKRARESKR